MCQALVDESVEVKDIFDVLGNVPMDNYCGSNRSYREWEQEIAEPKLNELGYEVRGWRTTDGDSFGPLCREVTCLKDGRICKFCYG